MRINAERERISRFKSIAEECALTYYNIMEKFSKLQEKFEHGQYTEGSISGAGGSGCLINVSQ
jgi:hypothetical protein